MPSIDERVVSMAFENQVFESRVAVTMATLGKLDSAVRNIGGASGFDKIEAQANKVTLQGPMSALDKLRARLGRSGEGAAEGFGQIDKAGNKVTLEGPSRAIDKLKGKMGQLSAGSTFTDIEKASDKVELRGITRAIDNVSNKFSVLEGAASVALGNIASQAALKGGSFVKSFAFGPLQQGLEEYQTNLGSIQTILANTQGQQVSGLDATQKALGELNKYSDRTIYNFGEMAKNIGTFTAAGVDLPKATESIKGIANLAALSGSNSQQASTAMYQLSQAIAAGKVGLQDWNSVVNAGMGGAVFQKSLMRTAENMGALEKGAVKIDKATGKATVNGQSFRESIMAKPGEQSWLTSDVLTKTLGQFTGDLTNAELAAQGFSKEQIKAIQAQAKTAQEAATQVKTLPQVFDVARETIGSGWAKTFSLIFGNFEESKKTFTEFSNFINGIINQVSDARNKVLGEWKKLGGRTELIEGIKAAFEALMGIITPIKDAFRDIFPAQTGKSLFEFTKNFRELMESLKPSPELMDNLRRIFGGFFAVVHIGWTIVKELVGVIFDLLGVVGKGSGGFLGFVAGIGDFLKAADAALTKGGAIKEIFKTIGAVLTVPLRLLGLVGQAIGNLFGDADTSAGQAFETTLQGTNKQLKPLRGFIDNVVQGWKQMLDILDKVKIALDPFLDAASEKLSGLGDLVSNAFKGLDFNNVMQGLQTGFIAGIFLAIKKVLGKGGPLSEITETLGGVNKLIGGFTGQLVAMQQKIKAEALLAIAGAVLVLAGGIYILSKIPADRLTKAMTAVAVGLGELMGAMKLMTSGMGKLGVLQLPIIAAGLIGMATAVLILSGAMKIFATMSWEDIGKGLAGVAGSISAVGLAMKLMPPTLPLTAAGLILIGIALNLLAGAMKVFATMSLEELGKGLIGMGEALAVLAFGVSLMPPTMPLTAAGLILMGIALSSIGGAIRTMGSLDFETIQKGLITIALALTEIGVAMSLVPPTIALTAAGVLIVAGAMVVLAAAMKIMGGMSLEEIAKSLIAMGGALLVLGVGLTFMAGTLPGSVALMAAAVALAILAPTLGFLGTLSWGTIIKGLLAIALALGTLSIIGLVASAGLIQLGIALLPLAATFVIAAAGVFLFAKAMALLGAEGGKGVAVMVTALTAFIAAIPALVISFLTGLLSVVEEVVKLAPRIIEALGKILEMVIAFVVENAPKLGVAIGALVDTVIEVLVRNTPKLVSAGFKLLIDLLSGISTNIGRVTTKVAEIVTKFLNALATKTPDLVNSGAKVLIAFLLGITNKFPSLVQTVANMIIKFINAVAGQIPKIVASAGNLMVKFITAIGSYATRILKAGTNAILNFMDGVGEAIPRLIKKGLEVARKFLNGIADGLAELADIGFKAIIRFLNGLEKAIRKNFNQLFDAGAGVADAIIDGLVAQFGKLGPVLRGALDKVFGLLPGWAKKILGIHSPSTVFAEIGRQTLLGFVQGMDDNHRPIFNSAAGLAKGVINSVRGSIGASTMRGLGQEVGDGFKTGLDESSGTIGDSLRSTMQDSVARISTALADNIDANPVITPVLDLTQIQRGARGLSDLTNILPIAAVTSAGQARATSQEVSAAQQAVASTAVGGGPTFRFEQNNYSPEALSEVEIYRQTKNQIGQIKSALGLIS